MSDLKNALLKKTRRAHDAMKDRRDEAVASYIPKSNSILHKEAERGNDYAVFTNSDFPKLGNKLWNECIGQFSRYYTNLSLECNVELDDTLIVSWRNYE